MAEDEQNHRHIGLFFSNQRKENSMNIDTQGTVFIIAIGLMVAYNIIWAWREWDRIKNYIDRRVEDASANMDVTIIADEEESQQEESEEEESVI
jgi:hypothetical protein